MICCNLPHSLIYHMIEDYKAKAAPPDFEWWYVEGLGITIKCDSEADEEAISEWIAGEIERVESGVEANFYEN